MTRYFNRSKDRVKRRSLRSRMTPAEKKLWSKIRDEKIVSCRFRRQYSICGFVLDFYCPKKRLCIEVDGGIHSDPNQRMYDNERSHILNGLGIFVLRLTNAEIINNVHSAARKIKAVANDLPEFSPLRRGR